MHTLYYGGFKCTFWKRDETACTDAESWEVVVITALGAFGPSLKFDRETQFEEYRSTLQLLKKSHESGYHQAQTDIRMALGVK